MFYTKKRQEEFYALEARVAFVESVAINKDESKFYSYVSRVDTATRDQIRQRDMKIKELEKQVKTMQEQWQDFLKQLTLRAIRGE